MGGCGDRGGEPVAKPSDIVHGGEVSPIVVDQGPGNRTYVPVGSPVDQFPLKD